LLPLFQSATQTLGASFNSWEVFALGHDERTPIASVVCSYDPTVRYPPLVRRDDKYSTPFLPQILASEITALTISDPRFPSVDLMVVSVPNPERSPDTWGSSYPEVSVVPAMLGVPIPLDSQIDDVKVIELALVPGSGVKVPTEQVICQVYSDVVRSQHPLLPHHSHER